MSEISGKRNTKVKCPTCGKKNFKSDVLNYKIKTRFYCRGCYKEAKEKADIQKTDTELYNELQDYITELYGIKKLTGQMFMQIKDYRKKFDYSYSGIRLTLQYFYEDMENPVDITNGLGITPYIYNKAEAYYTDLWKAMDYNEEVELIDTIRKVKPCSNYHKIKQKKMEFTKDDKIEF